MWEALGSKALVLVDRMYVELPHPLVDGEDVVYFDSLDKSSLVETVRYYLQNDKEARRIAMNGFYKVRRGRGCVGWASTGVCCRPGLKLFISPSVGCGWLVLVFMHP